MLFLFVFFFSFFNQAFANSCEGFEDGLRSKRVPTKTCHYSESQKCFSNSWRSNNRWPFQVRAENAKRVVICAHGLSDSPYYYKDVAGCMADVQTEVWGIRMAGHDDSLSGAAVRDGSWQKWRQQVCCAMKAARAQGKEPILCGFSTGGVSALVNALTEECGRPAGVILFSPAIYHNSPVVQWISEKRISRWLGQANILIPSFGRRKVACSRYRNMYTSGLDYLNQGMKELHSMNQPLDMPVFAFFSSDDQIVGVEKGIEYLKVKSKKLDLLYMGQKSKDGRDYKRPLNHSAIFEDPGCSQQSERNPYFSNLCSRLKGFLKSL